MPGRGKQRRVVTSDTLFSSIVDTSKWQEMPGFSCIKLRITSKDATFLPQRSKTLRRNVLQDTTSFCQGS